MLSPHAHACGSIMVPTAGCARLKPDRVAVGMAPQAQQQCDSRAESVGAAAMQGYVRERANTACRYALARTATQ